MKMRDSFMWGRLRRTVCMAIAMGAYPTYALTAFAAVKTVVVAWVLWQAPAHPNDAEYFVYPQAARALAWARQMSADYAALVSLDPNTIGATRGRAITLGGVALAASAMTSAVCLVGGLCIGRVACRMMLRPPYWERLEVAGRGVRMYGEGARRALRIMYYIAPASALAVALGSRTIEGGIVNQATPSVFGAVVLACTPAIAGTLAMFGTYRAVIRRAVEPSRCLCLCGYPCGFREICPECGVRNLVPPGEVRWRFRRSRLPIDRTAQ